jgi:hypothetical protein
VTTQPSPAAVAVSFANRETFLSQYCEEDGAGRLYPLDEVNVREDQETAIGIFVARELITFRTRAIPRRRHPRPATRSLFFEFLPREKKIMDMLVSFLRGDDSDVKRRARRFLVSVNCTIGFGGEFFPVQLEDISRGGVCVIASEEPAVGALLELRFPDTYTGVPLIIGGEVAWTKKGADSFGVRFLPIAEDAQRELDQLIAAVIKKDGLTR